MGTSRLLCVKSMFRPIKYPNAAGQMLLIPLYLLLSNVWFSLKVFYLLPKRGPTLLFWLSEDFAFTQNHTRPQRAAPGFPHRVGTTSLNSDIQYLALFLRTFTFKWQLHWAVLSLQMASHSLSIWSWYCGYFWLEKFNEGEEGGEFGFCWSWSFLPFSCVSSPTIPFPLWCGPCALALHLHGFGICLIPEPQLSDNYSETRDQKRGRAGERDFVSTIIWENKYLMITYFACSKLVWSCFTHRKCQKTNGAS